MRLVVLAVAVGHRFPLYPIGSRLHRIAELANQAPTTTARAAVARWCGGQGPALADRCPPIPLDASAPPRPDETTPARSRRDAGPWCRTSPIDRQGWRSAALVPVAELSAWGDVPQGPRLARRD